jgi:transglutaminase-like putative cysteine protease
MKAQTLTRVSTLWVIITLFVCMLPQINSMPVQLVLITLLPMVWRLLAEFRGWKPTTSLVRTIATLFAIATLLVTYGGLMGRRAAVSMLVLMLSLKLLETFRVRDARIVASLSLFLCATQFLFSQGLTMIIYIIACLLSSMIALMFLHRREAWENIEDTPDTSYRLFTEMGFGLRLLGLALPIGLVLFLFFPRWGSPLWGIPEEALDARSGLSGSMTPGSIQNLFMDDSPAFRATFEGEVPEYYEMYWRGPVFWDFDGRTWESGYLSQTLRAQIKPDPLDAPYRYRVQMEPTEQSWLFALDYTALEPRGTYMTIDYQLMSRRPVTRLHEFVMASEPDFTDSPELLQTLRNKALELPVDFNPRTAELIDRWRSEINEPAVMVQRALSHFNQEAFRYTLNPALLTRHSVDEFMFDTREGFCEHYASAFTVMMRMAGIPARVVTGYQGGWYNPVGSYVLVRQSDAHAWSEVWLEGQGWTRVDPTAAVSPSRIERGSVDSMDERRYMLDFEWLRNVRNTFDVFQRSWNEWIVAFNAVNQSRLFSMFGWEELDSAKLIILMIINILAISTVTFILAPYLMKYRTRRQKDPVIRAWHRFVRKLKKAGVHARPSMGPMELADRAGQELQDRADVIMNIARLYSVCRYSGNNARADELVDMIRRFQVRNTS